MTNQNLNLFLLRGLPNSGKSTLAEQLAPGHAYAADDYWYDLMNQTGQSYREVFDLTQLSTARGRCQINVLRAMFQLVPNIAVANTNLYREQYEPYVRMAEDNGYRVHYLLVERGPDHGDNEHDVPAEGIDDMIKKFQFVDQRFNQ